MSKVKSVIITVLLVLAIAVAAFFAAISFPVANNVKRINSIASNISLGADLSGYAYTTVYPEGVISAEDYGNAENKDDYLAAGGLYVEKEWLTDNGYVDSNGDPDIAALKKDVAYDAAILNKRFGQKGYSSYSVAVEDGVSIKVSVPTNYSYAAYKGNDSAAQISNFNVADRALQQLTAYGELTLRTTDTADITVDDIPFSPTKRGKDKWVEIAKINGSNSYSLADKYNGENEADFFKSITTSTVGKVSRITFNFTAEGRTKFKEITNRAKNTSSKYIYFCVGDRVIVNFECDSTINEKSLVLSASDKDYAENAAIVLNSAANGDRLKVIYKDYEGVKTTKAAGGENAALMTFIASIVVLVGLSVLLIVKYKRLGAIVSLISVLFALVMVYALFLLSIQVTFAVVITAAILLGLFVLSNVIAFTETKRMTESGRTMQASIKDAYKKVLMSVTDMHIVLVIVAILLAAVGVGEVAACGLIAVVGVVASYVLYWFTRFMWYALSSQVKDKFRFAGLKRVVYEDD